MRTGEALASRARTIVEPAVFVNTTRPGRTGVDSAIIAVNSALAVLRISAITMPVEPDIKALQDAIFWEKVERAKRTPIAERIATGPELFDEMIELIRGVIAGQNPEYTPEDVSREIRRRLAIGQMLDDAGLYRDAGVINDES